MNSAVEGLTRARGTEPTGRPSPLQGLAILRGVLVAFVMASSLVRPSIGQEEKPDGRIVLDIPIQDPDPEDPKEHVTIAVRGMMKSRSGAT